MRTTLIAAATGITLALTACGADTDTPATTATPTVVEQEYEFDAKTQTCIFETDYSDGTEAESERPVSECVEAGAAKYGTAGVLVAVAGAHKAKRATAKPTGAQKKTTTAKPKPRRTSTRKP